MDTTLIILLHGPLQSWGADSRFDERSTEATPTKSAIVGMIGAALGRRRGSDMTDLAALRMSVRVDRPGVRIVDFHTVGADYPKGRRIRNAEGKELTNPVVTRRHYLADAAFTVALTGPSELVAKAADAFSKPTWTVSLGRRSCPPAEPFLIGVTDQQPEAIFAALPIVRHNTRDRSVQMLHDDPAGTSRSAIDSPTGQLGHWSTYRHRRIRTTVEQAPPDRFVKDPFALIDALADQTES